MMTQAGPRCDVCGDYILPGCSESVNPFSLTGIEGTLLCHDACKPAIEKMVEAKDWRGLPNGPLRAAYEANERAILPARDETA